MEKKEVKEKTGREEKEYAYEKTLLYVYPYLGRMSEAIGRETEIKAALSYRRENTERVVEEMLTGILQRQVLQEVKREVREILKEFTEEEGYLLEYKFFRRKGKLSAYREDILSQTSERTFYRRQKKILRKFSALLSVRGLNERWFCENLLPMDWVEGVYRKVKAGQDVRVTGKHKRSPFLRCKRKDQVGSSFENPYSSAGVGSTSCRGRNR